MKKITNLRQCLVADFFFKFAPIFAVLFQASQIRFLFVFRPFLLLAVHHHVLVGCPVAGRRRRRSRRRRSRRRRRRRRSMFFSFSFGVGFFRARRRRLLLCLRQCCLFPVLQPFQILVQWFRLRRSLRRQSGRLHQPPMGVVQQRRKGRSAGLFLGHTGFTVEQKTGEWWC